MRHQQLKDHDSYAKVDVAAVWPASAQVAPLPLPEIAEAPAAAEFTPTPAAPELAGGVGGMIVAAYVALLTAFIFATVGSAESIFMVVIAAFFMFMFFMVPILRYKDLDGLADNLRWFVTKHSRCRIIPTRNYSVEVFCYNSIF